MFKTKVTWEYSIATQEQKDANLAFEQARASTEDSTVARSSHHAELQEKSTELSGKTGDSTAVLEVENDESADIIWHHWTRTWPDLASAQQWITVVLAKGAKSAVIVE
jgi:hypothetical protein